MHKIKIFDLPHLLDNFCQHLTLVEIRRCRQVNKDWQYLFHFQDGCTVVLSSDFVSPPGPFNNHNQRKGNLLIPHHHYQYHHPWSRHNNQLKYYCYRRDSIIKRNYNFEQQRLQHQDEILKYADRIRSLKLDSSDCYDDLHQNRIQFLIGSRCRRLKNLTVLTPLFPSSSNDDDKKDNDDTPLRNLKSLGIGYRQPILSASLPLSPCVLQDLLQSLPPGLLDFEWKGKVRSTLRDAAGQQQQEHHRGKDPKRLRPLKLRRLYLFEYDFAGAEVSVLIPLIRSCPHLEEIHLPAVEERLAWTVVGSLIESCPRLCSFKFGSKRFRTAHWTSSPVIRLLQAYSSSIQEIILTHQLEDDSLQIMNDLSSRSRSEIISSWRGTGPNSVAENAKPRTRNGELNFKPSSSFTIVGYRGCPQA
ncbi:hypothetical protein BGZ83_009663 [Gryganskiella cystojenkinii]|nr:hypothetical protein BGZ83_009663 [Gryganskiella cystojenkinii]